MKKNLLLLAIIFSFGILHAQSLPLKNNDGYLIRFSHHIIKSNTSSKVVPPSNDSCANAIDINSLFGGPLYTELVSGPYDNTFATTDVTDPTTGWSCFAEPNGSASAPELNNTLWFKFTGDGGYYYMESGTCAGVINYILGGDTQFALYTGTCGSLTPVKCSEDGPNATSTTYPAGFAFTTTLGATYYLMVDGFNYLGTLAIGEFCIKVTQLPIIPCNDVSITSGTTTQNNDTVCLYDGSALQINVTGAIAPNVGDYSGISLVVSNGPLTYADPNADPAAIVYYNFASPAPAVFTRSMANNGNFILNPGAYYFTPILFGNAVAFSTPTKFLNNLTLDTNCITFGTPAIFNVLDPSDPFCTIGITETNKSTKSRLFVYPSPATDNLHVDFIALNETKATITVTDYLGRRFIANEISANEGINKNFVDVKQLAPGLYLVTVSDENGLQTKRFVKD